MISPSELMIQIANRVSWGDRYRKPGRPGEVIEGISEEYRKVLRRLKSKDIENLRPEYLSFGRNVERKQWFLERDRKLMDEFDQLIKRHTSDGLV